MSSVSQLIGNTPLIRIPSTLFELPETVTILAKLERASIGGSVKDRVALQMVNDAEAAGILKKGSTIVEATSGNTGVGLAMIGAERGYHVILTMPPSVSVERRGLLASYGAELILTDGGMAGAVKKAEEIVANTPNAFYAKQFENPSNPKAHELTTGPEIEAYVKKNNLKIDYFVAAVGTGGTVSGTGRYLKAHLENPIQVIAVEPEKSPMLSQGHAAAHGIQGIGANFVPKNFDRSVANDIVLVSDEDAFAAAKTLAHAGILVGISAGCNVSACVALAKKSENKNITLVTVLPDTGERYLSVFANSK